MFFRRVFSRKEHSAPTISRSDHDSNSSNTVTCSPKRTLRKSSSDEKRGLSVLQLTPLWEHIIRTKSLPSNVCEKRIFEEFAERLHDPEWQVRQHALRVLVDVLIVMGPQSDQYFQLVLVPLIENLSHAAPAVRKGALDALKVYMTETAMIESILLQIIDLGMERKPNTEYNYGGRMCVGTMLALPAIVYTCLGTNKQVFVLRTVIDALTNKMIVMPYQEVALKVLLRIREMIGVREFSEYIAHGAYREFELLCNVYGLHSNTNTEIDMYIPGSAANSANSWQLYSASTRENHCKIKRTELNWRNDDDADDSDDFFGRSLDSSKYRRLPEICSKSSSMQRSKSSADAKTMCPEVSIMSKCPHSATIASVTCDDKCDKEKVIMETEIKIQDTPVTMRIVEASNDNECSTSMTSTDEDNASVYEHSGVVRVLTDSELEEVNNSMLDNIPRTPKRVTFGGEEVKMRTPDSDSVLQSDNDDLNRMARQLFEPPPKFDIVSDGSTKHTTNRQSSSNNVPTRPSTTSSTVSHAAKKQSTEARYKSASPVRRRQSFGANGPENMSLSPRATHKGIEVFHNLQRSPSISPSRSRRTSPEKQQRTITTSGPEPTDNNAESMSSASPTVLADVAREASKSITTNSGGDAIEPIAIRSATEASAGTSTMSESTQTNFPITNAPNTDDDNDKNASWETLDLVDEECLRNLKSGVCDFTQHKRA